MAGSIAITVEGGIARLVLTNPERRNAISSAMWRALSAFAQEAAGRTDIHVAVLRGAGDLAFSGGADISDFDTARSDASGAQSYDELVEGACSALESLPFPTVALVRGACVGAGAALAASCDMRIAADDAFFAIPAARLGLGYDPRGMGRVLRVFGSQGSRQLFFTADRLPATRAHALGAVDAIASPAEVDAAADRILQRISENAPLTLKAAKLAIRAAETGAAALLADARRATALANASADYREGRRAFAEKRAPRFSGS
ncbi:enoyl-CoA hydratase/isomerase family protein [Xanthobacter dioxanivorans]|uniref:Enoyl-CoA hydratase/isomerase family protein n=1 Tax=Xanthobacter dioxanivorans TaxID=2528964 RepID=A0A974PRU3_9HYPH|nr:enoyl-CoA hydratase-related protein [Xanthobacter dioxanivorans]QRG08520.1 enoyl-CoA hydratase/isomerase family protein [Xanthobacter dioxanivorans]